MKKHTHSKKKTTIIDSNWIELKVQLTILTHWREMMMMIIIVVKKTNAMHLPPHFKFVQICMYTFFIIIITNGFACVVISLDPYIIVRFIRVYTPFNMLHSSIIFNRSASGKIFSDLRRRRFSYWCNFVKDFYFVPQLHFALKTSGLISVDSESVAQ